MRNIILVLFLGLFSFAVLAKTDCSKQVSTKDMRECAEMELEKTEKQLADLEKNLYGKMKTAMGADYADNFERINSEWNLLIEKQCKHKREFYGRGSMARVSQINCVDVLKKDRIKSLQAVYDEMLSGR